MIEIIRDIFTEKSTIGQMFFDGDFLCDTLEDKVRSGEDHVLQADEKIYGETAIPAGTYEIMMNHWDKYRCKMPMLLNVPLFAGIYIHPGNYPINTFGCILVGERQLGTDDFVSKSRVTFFEKVLPMIHDWMDSGRTLYITVR